MWKIWVEYDDKSKLTLTGKHPDIPLHLALQYQELYVAGKECHATYQQYPKKAHNLMPLQEKIQELEN